MISNQIIGHINQLKKNDLLSLDIYESVVMPDVDVSAECDTIDYEMLSQHLKNRLKNHGEWLQRIKSYITNRYQKVVIGISKSNNRKVEHEVPQGLILGPLIIFTLHITPVADLIIKMNLNYQIYSDETFIYTSFKIRNKTLFLRC